MNSEKSFQSLESKINIFPTFILRTLLYGVLLFGCGFLILLPAYGIYKRGIEVMLIPALICFPIGFGILIPSVKHYIIKRNLTASKIIINETGILYCNSKNETVKKIRYADLVASGKEFDISSHNTRNSGIIPLLEVFTQSEKDASNSLYVEMTLPLHVVKDRYTLYARFLQGISIFRPDLKIAPQVFHSYFIDPETWKIDRKSEGFILLFVILAAFLICGLILWLVFYFT
ncbi:hypothetical protein [Chryseobacterium sp. JM1]|uniref:hypothetical protein n=1 Tax=Chryseobacterium sp. JM1 TaxID=1233950 RepID=UPI0004E6B6E4|nr:hypothetical protein [Chryseobacterium sp. JM1]KFF20931.1 hypothetical protein IW22_11505 [Chryseobacterium sp. JM1]